MEKSEENVFEVQEDKVATEILCKVSTQPFIINFGLCGRLIRLQNFALRIQYQLACLSTLGGAYHLCNHPALSLKLARQQELVGKHVCSNSIIIRSKIFKAINHGLLGNIRKSKKIFNSVKKLLKETDSNNDLSRLVVASENWLQAHERKKKQNLLESN
jgi:hypothetical protein